MRVLMLTQFYPPVLGGQERHVRDLAHALVARGHELEVATIGTDGVFDTVPDGAVLVHRLRATAQRVPRLYTEPGRPHALPVPDPELRAGIGRLLAARGFDVAHAHDWIVNSLLGPARRTHTPVVLTQHDYSHVCATKRMMRGDLVCPGPALIACVRCASAKHGPAVGPGVVFANFAGRRGRRVGVTAFVPVSATVASRTGLTPPTRYDVIPNFVPDEILVDPSSLDGVDHGGPMVFVGDVTRDKGVEVLFEAYGSLSSPPPLVLAGRQLPDAPRHAPPGVELLGPISPDAVLKLMRHAGMIIVPSIVLDACPTVVLEAMAAARPVVASASGGISDLVVDRETGILVPPGNAPALAAALGALIADPVRAKAMGRKGLERVRGYTASAIAGRVEALYRQVASRAH
jgi:glycogen synthase